MTANNPLPNTDQIDDAVMAAIDDSEFDRPHLIIADTSGDTAWIAIPESRSCVLSEWA